MVFGVKDNQKSCLCFSGRVDSMERSVYDDRGRDLLACVLACYLLDTNLTS